MATPSVIRYWHIVIVLPPCLGRASSVTTCPMSHAWSLAGDLNQFPIDHCPAEVRARTCGQALNSPLPVFYGSR